MSSMQTPEWKRRLREGRASIRELDVGQWLRSIARPAATSPSDELKQRLNHQLELLRDGIAEARQAGLSWSTIGAMVGLTPQTVQSLQAD